MPVRLKQLPASLQQKLKQRNRNTGQSAKPGSPRSQSGLEAEFALQLWAAGLQGYKREFKFHPDRRWRADFAWEAQKVIVELQGGVWTSGRHTRGSGYVKDRERTNTAITLGWKVLELTPETIKNGRGIEWLRCVLKQP